MASNKENSESRKLYQEILHLKGKIALYSEYIGYYKVILENKTNEKRNEKLALNSEAQEEIKFYLASDEEIYAAIEGKAIKEKEEELNLEYRKLRESQKHAIEDEEKALVKAKLQEKQAAADPAEKLLVKVSDEELAEIDASFNGKREENAKELAAFKEELDKQLEAYKAEVKAAISQEKAGHDANESKKQLEELQAKQQEELAEFDKKEQENNEKKYAKNKEKIEKKIAKLEAQLKEATEKLAALNQKELADSPLAEHEILKVDDLCMYFGGLHAVDHLNFTVNDGEIYGLIGPNGAGKTTVFNCITQFYKPTAGELTFRTKENDIINLKEEEVHNIVTLGIARTFQNVEVIPECTVLENMLIAANRQYRSTLFDHLIHSQLLKLEESVITQRALKVLGFMGLLPYAYHLTMGLPYGILKKIEIARTLMTNPQLIILDEPAAGLNDSETKELANLIRTIRSEYNCTILLVEHDMGLVMDICDRICAISFGKLLAIGTPAEIQANKEVQEAYLGVSEEEE